MIDFLLRPEERAALWLRELYSGCGCAFYRMNRFEEYDFYSDKKDFLASKNILTFSDADGRLMALRPDVTLSIIKHFRDDGFVQRFFYNENVYRVSERSGTFREFQQIGVEFMGDLDIADVGEVIELAVKSLKLIAGERDFILDVCDASLLPPLIPVKGREEALRCLAAKNIRRLKELGASKELLRLASMECKPSQTKLPEELEALESLGEYDDNIRIDYSCAGNFSYYSGIVFKGFIEGVSECVLAGGRYDGMMALMGHEGCGGIGFAVNLEETVL